MGSTGIYADTNGVRGSTRAVIMYKDLLGRLRMYVDPY